VADERRISLLTTWAAKPSPLPASEPVRAQAQEPGSPQASRDSSALRPGLPDQLRPARLHSHSFLGSCRSSPSNHLEPVRSYVCHCRFGWGPNTSHPRTALCNSHRSQDPGIRNNQAAVAAGDRRSRGYTRAVAPTNQSNQAPPTMDSTSRPSPSRNRSRSPGRIQTQSRSRNNRSQSGRGSRARTRDRIHGRRRDARMLSQ
jgi:hypothetical protein